MSTKRRVQMSRKQPTQNELEKINSSLKRRVTQLEKQLKRAVRQLQQYEDFNLDLSIDADEEMSALFNKPALTKNTNDDDFLTFTLSDGTTKTIKKRIVKE